MIDHYTLLVSDYDRSKAFYLAALEPIGYGLIMEITREQIPDLPFERMCGLGTKESKPDLWLRPHDGPLAPTHLAMCSPNRVAVRAFHTAALAAGGKDHGAPGLRTDYHPNYYAAFVIDPDGYILEAVCHGPE